MKNYSSNSIEFKIINFELILFRHVDENKKKYIDRLSETVAIKSVSAWPECRQEVIKMCHWVADVNKVLN